MSDDIFCRATLLSGAPASPLRPHAIRTGIADGTWPARRVANAGRVREHHRFPRLRSPGAEPPSAGHGGIARTDVLQRRLPGIPKKMLTQTVRDMERAGLIAQHVYSAIPPAVEYRLTPLGNRFLEPVELPHGWGVRMPTRLISGRVGQRRGGPNVLASSRRPPP